MSEFELQLLEMRGKGELSLPEGAPDSLSHETRAAVEELFGRIPDECGDSGWRSALRRYPGFSWSVDSGLLDVFGFDEVVATDYRLAEHQLLDSDGFFNFAAVVLEHDDPKDDVELIFAFRDRSPGVFMLVYDGTAGPKSEFRAFERSFASWLQRVIANGEDLTRLLELAS